MKLCSMAQLLKDHQNSVTQVDTSLWLAKTIFLLIGVVSTTILLIKFSIPYIVSLLSTSIPKLSNFIISWFVPPYLFITIHFIILIIWKLQQHQHPVAEEDESTTISPNLDTTSLSLSLSATSVSKISSEIEITPKNSVEIPLEFEPLVFQKEISKQPDAEAARPDDKFVQEREPKEPPPNIEETCNQDRKLDQESEPKMIYPVNEETITDESLTSDTMDDMWKAIMDGGSSPSRQQTLARAEVVDVREFRKSATFKEAVKKVAEKEIRKSATFRESPSIRDRRRGGREVLMVDSDELCRRVEAFIKMNYDQMRMQRQESEKRFVGMVNAAY